MGLFDLQNASTVQHKNCVPRLNRHQEHNCDLQTWSKFNKNSVSDDTKLHQAIETNNTLECLRNVEIYNLYYTYCIPTEVIY